MRVITICHFSSSHIPIYLAQKVNPDACKTLKDHRLFFTKFPKQFIGAINKISIYHLRTMLTFNGAMKINTISIHVHILSLCSYEYIENMVLNTVYMARQHVGYCM